MKILFYLDTTMKAPAKLVWLDLEMTGLNPQQDSILELATIITDSELSIIAVGPELVLHCDQATLATCNELVAKMHTSSGLFDRVRSATTTEGDAEQQTIDFIKQHCEQPPLLCGNSIWQDRLFLRQYMPQLEAIFHYRMIDVSTIKELVARWYAVEPYQKQETHRALKDVEESIAELRYYREQYFVGPVQ